MTQTLIVVVLFVAAMAMLPWLVRRLQQRQAGGVAAPGASSRVLSAVAVGAHQRVVTVEVGPDHARTVLVLGVTAQQVSCLHVFGPAVASSKPSVPGFAVAMEKAVAVEGVAVPPAGNGHGG